MGNEDYQTIRREPLGETREIEEERKLLRRYVRVEGVTDCYTCNNCGSGDCSSCCEESEE